MLLDILEIWQDIFSMHSSPCATCLANSATPCTTGKLESNLRPPGIVITGIGSKSKKSARRANGANTANASPVKTRDLPCS